MQATETRMRTEPEETMLWGKWDTVFYYNDQTPHFGCHYDGCNCKNTSLSAINQDLHTNFGIQTKQVNNKSKLWAYRLRSVAIASLQNANSMQGTFTTAAFHLGPFVPWILIVVGIKNVSICLDAIHYQKRHVPIARLLELLVAMIRSVVEEEV